MEPINLIAGINLFVLLMSNIGGAKKGLKLTLTKVAERPKTYLQKWPPNIAAFLVLVEILAVFQIGTLAYSEDNFLPRLIGLGFYLVFSWLQYVSFKSLGEYYTQEIALVKGHKLKTDGLYKYIRHPQYLSQILSDLAIGVALLGYIVIPIVVLIEIPLFILRAREEERIMEKFFQEEFLAYKKKSGFLIPFL
jgi:protein-S-isoprenylcysteine O-methyltransferase Ste14